MKRSDVFKEDCESPIRKKLNSYKDVEEDKRDSTPQLDPEYYLESGLRKVKPYYFTYECYAKGRWINSTLFEVFAKEFVDQPTEYYKNAILKGDITINDKRAELNQVIRNGDRVQHVLHRHEPPVTSSDINIVFQDSDTLVIDKPPSIPVHPSGRYRFNTVLYILQYQHKFDRLFPLNRLDRLTSGLMIIALNKERARVLEKEMRERLIKKQYICKVKGPFPLNVVSCAEPINTVSHKLGICAVDRENGRECLTRFRLLCSDDDSSLLLCFPETGRMHQIRVHLSHLGFPILNDPLYGENPQRNIKSLKNPNGESALNAFECDDNDETERNTLIASASCNDCLNPRKDPIPSQMLIYLHAFKYSSSHWSYETSWPSWALEMIENCKAEETVMNWKREEGEKNAGQET